MPNVSYREWLSDKIARFWPDMINMKLMELEFTNYCNTTCIMCPRSSMKRPFGYISEETILNIINEISKEKILDVNVCGFGEPTMHKDFFKFCALFLEKQPKMRLTLTSNFQFLDKEALVNFKELPFSHIYYSWSGISQDSYKEIMGKNTFEEQIDKLDFLIMNKHPDTKIFIRYIFTHPHPFRHNEIINFFSEWKEAKLMIIPSHNRSGFLKSYSTSFRKRRHIFRCDMLRYITFIAWNGDSFACVNDLTAERIFGNINKDQLKSIIKARQQSEFEEDYPFNGCHQCTSQTRYRIATGGSPAILSWLSRILE
ncbi:MAG: radical SAM protein [Candidatus Coatesbacteria bacterium]|nr:radical SAM protein [Candidatus Coatesbacteria bacterium]